ncbi:MAG: hypothetical protein Q7S12_04210 [bacterium]|nr:hypothetical protein [bacterium]
MKQINQSKRNSLAKAISLYQEYENCSLQVKNACSWVIGVTGVTAAGKSTLGRNLVKQFRKKDLTVAAILIDPSSKKEGWAILADRNEFRDPELDCDNGLFLRSLASRGEKSALVHALPKIIAHAKMFADIVIVETAGAGQMDVEIEDCVDTLIQVLAPLEGPLNMEKAGINECAHIFAVNAREYFQNSEQFFALAEIELGRKTDNNGWQKKVFLVNAKEKKGIIELIEGLYAHKKFLEQKKPSY